MIKNSKIYIYLRQQKSWMINTFAPVYGTKKIYYYTMNKELNLDNPKDINEKIQYLKLNDYRNNRLVTNCADKYAVREYLTGKGYERLLPELYGTYRRVNEIEWDKLPDQFVLKCTHGSGYNIICPNKEYLDIQQAKKNLSKWLRERYVRHFAEIQYKNITPRIIVEEYLGEGIKTFKFYCFNGVPRILYVSFMGENGEKDKYIDYYDMDWNRLAIRLGGHDNNSYGIPKPNEFDEMIDIARDLSKDFKFVRVDLYNINGRIYFSELTFTPTGGMMKLKPDEVLLEWGNWLTL